MATLDEILAALAAEVGDDKAKAKEIAKALRAKVGPLAQVLIDVGAGKKKGEVDKDIERITKERDDAIGERDELTTELEELKKKTPNTQEIEAGVTKRFEKKIAEKDAKIAELSGSLTGERRATRMTRLARRLESEHRIDPEWTETALDAKYSDRLVFGEDGTAKVLQLGGTEAYDAESEDAAIEKLAADIAKKVPERFVLTGADSGGGVGNGTGNRGGSSAANRQKLIDEKRKSGEYATL